MAGLQVEVIGETGKFNSFCMIIYNRIRDSVSLESLQTYATAGPLCRQLLGMSQISFYFFFGCFCGVFFICFVWGELLLCLSFLGGFFGVFYFFL